MMKNRTLYIAGYGVLPEKDRCVLIDEVIEKSEAIFMLEKPGSWLDRKLSNHNCYVKNYIDLYKDGEDRVAIYENIAQDIIIQFKCFSKAAFLTEGSPFFLDFISSTIETKANEINIDVVTIPGLSSLDKILFELRIPIERFGAQIYLASFFCNDSPSINEDGILILMQPGNIGSTAVTINMVDKRSIHVLQEKLISIFSEKAIWILVNLSCEHKEVSRVLWGELDNLSEFFNYMHSGSLVISSAWKPEFLDGVEMTSIE